MSIRFILCFALSFCTIGALAQETPDDGAQQPPQQGPPTGPQTGPPAQPSQTWSPRPNNLEESNRNVEYGKVMIVPFESKLYQNDGDRHIAAANDMSVYELRHRLRYGLAEAVYRELARNHPGMMMFGEEGELMDDLGYIYRSIGYQYKLVPDETVDVPKNKLDAVWGKAKALKEKVIPTEEEPAPGTRVEEGQVVTVWGNEERYMATRIHTPNVLSYMSDKYEVQYFIFINQLDILVAPGTDYREFEAETYRRRIKVHYSVVDRFGNEVYGGAAMAMLPHYVTDLDRIVKGKFTDIARQISFRMPDPSLSTTNAQAKPRAQPTRKKAQSDKADDDYEMETDY